MRVHNSKNFLTFVEDARALIIDIYKRYDFNVILRKIKRA
nr:MAG TPA: hypothetical protein [Caudoviricetes sp.]